MPVQMRPAQIDFSSLGQMGQNVGAAIGQNNLNSAFQSAIGPDGTFDYNKGMSILAQRDPRLAMKLASGIGRGGAGSDVFGTPIYGEDPNTGETVLGVIGKNGTFQRLDTGGVNITPGVQFLNQGTQFVPADKRTGAPVGKPIPIDVAGRAGAQAVGQAQGDAVAGLPDAIGNTQTAIETIDLALKHPGRERATGISGTLDPRNYAGGTEGTSYRVGPLAQIQGQAFLSSIQQMRGLGQLSNAEGQAATDAATALNTQQTDEDHKHSLLRLKTLMLRGLLRSYEKAGQDIPQNVIDQWNNAERASGLQGEIPFQSYQPNPQPQQQPAPVQAGSVDVYNSGGGARPVPTPQQIDMLRQYANDPDAIKTFEEFYGAGSADWFLRGGR